MTLTPEQFNKLTTKDDFEKLENKVDDLDQKIDRLITATESIATNFSKIESEQISNISAHDRFEQRITKIEEKVGI